MSRHPLHGILVVRLISNDDGKSETFYTGRMYNERFHAELCFQRASLIKAPVENMGASVVYWTHRVGSLNVERVHDFAPQLLFSRTWYVPDKDKIRVYWLPDPWRAI